MKTKIKSAKSGQGNSITYFDEKHDGRSTIKTFKGCFLVSISATPNKTKKKTGGKV